MLKLLSKKEIQTEKTSQERQLAQEGLKLAKRVDRLRELSVQEEASLEQFRSQTIAAIYKEIDETIEKRDKLKAEIAAMTFERNDLTRLISEEWEKVGKAQPELDRIKKTLDEREAKIAELEETSKELAERATALANEASQERKEAERIMNESLSEFERVEAEKREANTIHSEALELRSTMQEELEKLNMEVAAREKAIAEKEDSLADREKAIEAGWRLLNDRKAMFERNINRLT